MSRATDIGGMYLGVQELNGPNEGPILRTIRNVLLYSGAPPCSWCALFVAWNLWKAYGPVDPNKARKWLREALGFGAHEGMDRWYVESCQSWWEYAMATRCIVDHPQPGDVFILLNGERHAHHMGFVTATHPEYAFDTVEGNTNAGGSVNGDGVYRRTRTANERTVFVRLPEPLRA